MWETRFKDPKKMAREERSVLEKIIDCSIMSNTDNDEVPVVYIRFDMVNFTMDTISNFIDIVVDNLKIKGLDHIVNSYDPSEEACVRMDTPDHSIQASKEYVIYTSGINMYDIRYINGIDISRTLCNDIVQINEIFGIEAARIALLREITTLLETMGTFVNYNHLSILVDLMTRNGIFISIDVHGIGRTDASLLGKASFEKPIDQFITSAIFGETDLLDGVSGRIMTGHVIKGGTGMCDILFDTDAVEKSEYVDISPEKSITINDSVDVINDILGENRGDLFIPI
jgi:DNA-directed RNA polymerase II subunit RPB1